MQNMITAPTVWPTCRDGSENPVRGEFEFRLLARQWSSSCLFHSWRQKEGKRESFLRRKHKLGPEMCQKRPAMTIRPILCNWIQLASELAGGRAHGIDIIAHFPPLPLITPSIPPSAHLASYDETDVTFIFGRLDWVEKVPYYAGFEV